jgi:hypothetical protein
MRGGPRSKPFRLGRAPKVMGVPLSRMTVKDLNKAMKDVIMRQHASDEERDARMEMCHDCEHRKATRCNLCGCFINYKAKLKNSECPIGKWSGFVPEPSVDDPSEKDAGEENTH